MTQQQDDVLRLWADKARAYGLYRVAAIYAAIDAANLDASFALANQRLADLYASLKIASSTVVDEYLLLAGLEANLIVEFEWPLSDVNPNELPSGLDVRDWLARAPFGVKRLVGQQMTVDEALRISKARTAQAVGSVVHETIRANLAADVTVMNEPDVPTWADHVAESKRALFTVDELDTVPTFLPSTGDAETWALPDTRMAYTQAGRSRILNVNNDFAGLSAYSKARYRRVPQPGACDFCLLMATRGATYSSYKAAKYVGFGKTKRRIARSTIKPQPKGGKYHDHCRCIAVVQFVGPEVDMVISEEDFQRLSSRNPDGTLTAFGLTGRKYYTLSNFRVAVYDGPEPPDWMKPRKPRHGA